MLRRFFADSSQSEVYPRLITSRLRWISSHSNKLSCPVLLSEPLLSGRTLTYYHSERGLNTYVDSLHRPLDGYTTPTLGAPTKDFPGSNLETRLGVLQGDQGTLNCSSRPLQSTWVSWTRVSWSPGPPRDYHNKKPPILDGVTSVNPLDPITLLTEGLLFVSHWVLKSEYPFLRDDSSSVYRRFTQTSRNLLSEGVDYELP